MIRRNAAGSICLVLVAWPAHAADPLTAPSSSEIQYTVSPIGSTFYYDPASAKASADGKTGTVRVRIVHSEKFTELFDLGVASATGVLVFNCAERTYVLEQTQDFDSAGNRIERNTTGIVLQPIVQSVNTASEPVYEVACSKRSAAEALEAVRPHAKVR